jgi:hypothetical protein
VIFGETLRKEIEDILLKIFDEEINIVPVSPKLVTLIEKAKVYLPQGETRKLQISSFDIEQLFAFENVQKKVAKKPVK